MPSIIEPYGGALVNLLVREEEREGLKAYASRLASIQLTPRQVCDLELLACGAFSPLDRFMGLADHQRVLDEMRLSDGRFFPMPITLPVNPSGQIALGDDIALRDPNNNLLAIISVEEVYDWDVDEVSQKVFGTLDTCHPLVAEMQCWPKTNLSGRLRVIEMPRHYDFQELRLTPAQTRERLDAFGLENVVAFQTCSLMHRMHEELARRAADEVGGVLLLHPVVGMAKPGDVDHFIRVRTYKALVAKYDEPSRILLSLLPLAMRMGGPREALWHALIQRNYGANHSIVRHDHAGSGNNSQGQPFYGPHDIQEVVERYSDELGVKMVPFRMLVYLPEEGRYEEVSKVPAGVQTIALSDAQVREEYLHRGRLLPEWFTHREVAEILADAYPPRHKQGFCVWFTGLSGAGKSTTAEILTVKLQELGRHATLLDGDVVRTHLSKGLGFSKEDRDINIRRIGFVAAEIVRHGGVVVCAAVSPYRATRNEVRVMVGTDNFVEVFVDTPLEICEERDVKGLYAKAHRGEIKEFTGIDDPYEAPMNPEIVLDTVGRTVEENAALIVQHLGGCGFLRAGLESG